MEKLNKQFVSGNVLTAAELNQVTAKTDELVGASNQHETKLTELEGKLGDSIFGYANIYGILYNYEFVEGEKYVIYCFGNYFKLDILDSSGGVFGTIGVGSRGVKEFVANFSSKTFKAVTPGSNFPYYTTFFICKQDSQNRVISKIIDELTKDDNVLYEYLGIAKNRVRVNYKEGFIGLDGNVNQSNSYLYSEPIEIGINQTILVKTKSYGYTAISRTNKEGSFYEPIVKSETGNISDVHLFKYKSEDLGYVAISGFKGNLRYVIVDKSPMFDIPGQSEIENIVRNIIPAEVEKQTENIVAPKKNIPFEIRNNAIIVDRPYGNIIEYGKGDCIIIPKQGEKEVYLNIPNPKFKALGGIAFYNGEPSSQTIIGAYNTVELNNAITISFPQTADRVVVVVNKPGRDIQLTTNDVQVNDVFHYGETKEYCKINLLPMRTLVGKTEWLYKESLITSLSPIINMDVITSDRDKNITNYSDKAFKFEKNEPGIYPIRIHAVDALRNVTTKETTMTVRKAPPKKLTAFNECNVVYFGDSLIFANQNLIGREWLRMLNTDDPGEVADINGAKKLKALNNCDNKIRMFGETLGQGNAPFTVASSVTTMCIGKHSEDIYGNNPFYNPGSAEPDELDVDGINKRVDFGWWFDKVIGLGKYPHIVYIATSPNDYANHFQWSENATNLIVERMAAISKRIKKECDKRASGTSRTVIKFIQHQPYTRNCSPGLNFQPFLQRILWQSVAERFYKKIKDDGINTYVDIVPCAAFFDVDLGYYYTPQKNNVRSDKISDYYVGDGIHMAAVGSYNYADVLITDFIADERFD